ncbi:CAP domain-containing protein [Globomyces pollinis-pini]|nr:CAP domain-containing protein [Globomyces pollinis-pini]
MVHSGTGNGENIYGGASSCQAAVDAFMSEKQFYKPKVPMGPLNNYQVVGHFTQVMWRGTTQVGCGIADKIVCQYSPAGNMGGVVAF